jgi:glycosyltransferase involved in cell wall biosynthesis
MLLATAYLFGGDEEKAIELFGRLKKKNYDASEFLAQLAKHLADHGKESLALVLLSAAVETNMVTGNTQALIEECERKIKEKDSRIQGAKGSSETEKDSRIRGVEDSSDESKNKGSTTRTLESSAPGTLSLCMIVKNEENNIRRALMTVKPVVDEMIVVDTGSTDRTKDIAQELGAKVYDFPWTDSFAEARNYSLSKATGDWILILDADEVISPSDHEKLRKLISKEPRSQGFKDSSETENEEGFRPSRNDKHSDPRILEPLNPALVAYLFTTRNYVIPINVDGWIANDGTYRMEEAGSGWFSGEKVRLFPNDERIRFEDPVHERVEPSIETLGIMIRQCPVTIHHYGKLDEEKRRAKNEYYYHLGKKRLAEKGNSDYLSVYDLAVQASSIGRYLEAITYLTQVIAVKPDFVKAFTSMGNVYYNLGQYEKALSSYRKSMELDPNSRDAEVMSAQCEIIAGNAENAIQNLELLVNKEHASEKALLLLVAAYSALGQQAKALSYISKLSTMKSGLTAYLSDFARLLISQGKNTEAQRLLEAAEEIKSRLD